VSLQNYKWQHAGAKLAICPAGVEGHQAGPRAVITASIMSLNIAGVNLAVLTLTAKLPNLNLLYQLLAQARPRMM